MFYEDDMVWDIWLYQDKETDNWKLAGYEVLYM